MFEVGFTEIILIVGLALLVLGPEKLPGLAEKVGRWTGRARAMARQIAASNPDAIRAAKRLLNGATPVDARRVLVAEAFEQQRLIASANQREAVQATLENRAPVFRSNAGSPSKP